MEKSEGAKALFIVVNDGFAESVIDIAREAGVTGATILSARGEGHHHERFMGISVDTEKEVILSVADGRTAEKAMAAVKEKAGVKTPAHSVCFTMSIGNVTGVTMPAEE